MAKKIEIPTLILSPTVETNPELLNLFVELKCYELDIKKVSDPERLFAENLRVKKETGKDIYTSVVKSCNTLKLNTFSYLEDKILALIPIGQITVFSDQLFEKILETPIPETTNLYYSTKKDLGELLVKIGKLVGTEILLLNSKGA